MKLPPAAILRINKMKKFKEDREALKLLLFGHQKPSLNNN
jgi:hypothetical protein